MNSSNPANSFPLPELIMNASIGVCSASGDTWRMAETAVASSSPGRALDFGTGSGFIDLYLVPRAGMHLTRVEPIPSMVRQVVAEFTFQEPA